MKHLSSLFFVLSFNLFAREAPQAYRSAQLEETDASGYVLQTFAFRQNTLTEMKRKDRTVSFEFDEVSGPPPCSGQVCPMMPTQLRHTVFESVRKSLSECGSTKFIGYSTDKKMVLFDHSTRICDDLKPAQWELRILGRGKSVRYFRGNPNKVGDPKCDRYTEDTVCMMLYSPATCTYRKTSAQGSNACFASAELKKKICEQGIDADAVPDEQILCSVEAVMMCPMAMCAAPPSNCHTEASSELDSNGCPKYLCGIVKCEP